MQNINKQLGNGSILHYNTQMQGRIQDFKLEGAHLKKLRRAEGGANIFGVFRVKNHDFTPNKKYFSLDPPLRCSYYKHILVITRFKHIQPCFEPG